LKAFKEQSEVRLQSKNIVEETGLAPAAVALIITNLDGNLFFLVD